MQKEHQGYRRHSEEDITKGTNKKLTIVSDPPFAKSISAYQSLSE